MLSLLYPENYERKSSETKYSSNLAISIDELQVERFIGGKIYLGEYFSCDPEVLSHRLDIFKDITAAPAILDALKLLHLDLDNYGIYRRTPDITKSTDNPSTLSAITDLRMYINFIESAMTSFIPLKSSFKSKGFLAFAEEIEKEASNEEFKNLKKHFSSLDDRIVNIKSITVGINLDANLNAKEAGIVSINSEVFKSGKLLDRLLRFDFSTSEYNTIAPLTEIESKIPYIEQQQLNNIVLNAMNIALGDALKNVKIPMQAYLKERMDHYYSLVYDLDFLIRGTRYINELKEKNIPVCFPKITNDGSMHITGLYSLELVNRMKSADDKKSIEPNHIEFDSGKGTVYILTGPNSGGKTVYLSSLGAAQVMFQIGLPVPAVSAEMTPFDCIFVHFPTKNGQASGKGRLEEECVRVAEIISEITEHSLILMDETFSSTGADEATELSRDIIKKLCYTGCKCIYSTHLHGLPASVDDINSTLSINAKGIVDTLFADIDGERRTYQVKRIRPTGSMSYAKDIASKYFS